MKQLTAATLVKLAEQSNLRIIPVDGVPGLTHAQQVKQLVEAIQQYVVSDEEE